MNWPFLALLVAAAIGAHRTWAARRDDGERTRTTNVPGYSVTSGAEFGVDPQVGLVKGTDWTAETIETFHSRGRSRVVITLDVVDGVSDNQLSELLAGCAREVASRSRAHVVYIEAMLDRRLRAALMWSPDGRGWNGVASRKEIFYLPESSRS